MCFGMAGGQYRVKLYELTPEYQWDDRGCGYLQCARGNDETSAGVRLVVHSESDNNVRLLESDVRDEIEYKKQQDTLILWTEPDGRDLALSFQEKSNCDEVWAKLQLFQSKVFADVDSDTHTTDVEEDSTSGITVSLPACTRSNLHDIADVLLHTPIAAKERVAIAVVEQDYIPQLLTLFKACEDEGHADDLAALFQVFKGIFLLNESAVFEVLLQPGTILDVIGALEYDPDLPAPIKHRSFLQSNTAFREVVPFNDDDIVDKIKLTHHVQYIKDVVLARVLEDTTMQILNSFIFFNYNDILRHISGDSRFLNELFSRVRDTDIPEAERCELVMFVRECVILKSVQHAVRASCFRALCSRGMFDIFPLALTSSNARLRLAATEILGALLSFDPHLVRTHIKAEYQTMKRSEAGAVRKRLGNNMLVRLMVACIVSNDQSGAIGQMSELLRTLLDTDTMDGYTMAEKSMFLGLFYDECFESLIVPLLASPEDEVTFRIWAQENRAVLYAVVDLLTSFVTRHTNRVRGRLLRDGAMIKIARLVELAPTYVGLSALRFFKAVVSLKDEFYVRHMAEENAILGSIARAFEGNAGRYNMLNSAIIDLCEQIHKAKLTRLLDHLVECHWPAFRSVRYVPTFTEILEDYKSEHSDSVLPWVAGDQEGAMDTKEAKTPDLLSVSEDDMDGAEDSEPVPAESDGSADSSEDALKKRKLQ